MIIFDYKKEPARTHGQFIYRPVAEVHLKSASGTWFTFHPYIDSGADVTLIPFTLGKLIGLDVNKSKIEQIGGIAGSIPVIYVKNAIKIGNREFSARLAWALIEDVPPLLGRADIFDFFTVTFKQYAGTILFEKRPHTS